MRVFADTHFWLALLNKRDGAHGLARRWFERSDIREVVTTSWVLVELANGMRQLNAREACAAFVEHMRGFPTIRIVPASEELLWRGFELYGSRRDKEWSLVDCLSFVVMKDEGLTDALTADHHFEQAGFRALLA